MAIKPPFLISPLRLLPQRRKASFLDRLYVLIGLGCTALLIFNAVLVIHQWMR